MGEDRLTGLATRFGCDYQHLCRPAPTMDDHAVITCNMLNFIQESHFLPQSLFFSLQFTIRKSLRCERVAQDRLIIALLEIRKVSAVKSTNFSALRAEAPLHGKPSLLETPSVNSCLRPWPEAVILPSRPVGGVWLRDYLLCFATCTWPTTLPSFSTATACRSKEFSSSTRNRTTEYANSWKGGGGGGLNCEAKAQVLVVTPPPPLFPESRSQKGGGVTAGQYGS